MPRCGERSEHADRTAHERGHYQRACRLIGQGYALSDIAARRNTPSLGTLQRWLAEDGDFRTCFDDARDARRERLADSIVALADNEEAAAKGKDDRRGPPDDLIERLEEARLRIDALNRAKAEADDPSETGTQSAGIESSATVADPKADATADAGEDNSWRDDARDWAIGIYAPT